jgi:peptidoglycan/xylan/chitin deacetylase (PgdA/CDA1 family)
MIGIFLHFHHRILSSYQQNTISRQDSTHLILLRDYFNSELYKAGVSNRKLNKNIDEHEFLLEIPLQKNSIVNIWRNDNPMIAKEIREEGKLPISIPLDYGENSLKIVALDPSQNITFQQYLQVTYRNPQVELFRKSIQRGNIDRKRIAITFDAGSDDSKTLEILQILNENQLKCTMFLTGKFIEEHPELVKRMLTEGHEMANHTYDHPHLTTYEIDSRHDLLPDISRQFIHRQLLKTDSVYFSLTGQHLQPFWRAPFGEYNDEILTWAAEAGYLHIYWTGSFDTHDWVTDEASSLFKTPNEVYDRILAMEKQQQAGLNGVIVLMHLGSQRTENHVYEVLPKLIRTIRDKGYSLGKISELLN